MSKVKVVVRYESAAERYRKHVKQLPKQLAAEEDARRMIVPENVTGSSKDLVNGKVSRPNKRHATKNIDTLIEVSVKPTFQASRPKKVRGAITLEQYRAMNSK